MSKDLYLVTAVPAEGVSKKSEDGLDERETVGLHPEEEEEVLGIDDAVLDKLDNVTILTYVILFSIKSEILMT